MAKTSHSRLLVKANAFMPRATATPPEYAAASAAFWRRILSSTCRPTFITIPNNIVNSMVAKTAAMLIVPSSSPCRFSLGVLAGQRSRMNAAAERPLAEVASCRLIRGINMGNQRFLALVADCRGSG